MFAPWKKSYGKPRQHIKKQWHYFANKSLSIQSYDFSSSHVWMWELDHKEGWGELKNWCFCNVMLDKTLESPLDSREIKPVNPKRNQLWIFTRRTDAEAEAPIIWPHDMKSQPILKSDFLSRTNEDCIRKLTYSYPSLFSLSLFIFWGREILRARGEVGNRGWDGWIASPTQWTWVWESSRR